MSDQADWHEAWNEVVLPQLSGAAKEKCLGLLAGVKLGSASNAQVTDCFGIDLGDYPSQTFNGFSALVFQVCVLNLFWYNIFSSMFSFFLIYFL
ncbi:MAG: hypothetical protein JKX96_00005 [Acinetobacter sp.]|nr:hypothetical protein [Acinetobacter sp.]